MNFTLKLVLGFCIVIPTVIGLIRFRLIDRAYQPFIYCIWIGCCNEIFSYILIKGGHPNAINNNVYWLIESLLFTYQFERWGLFSRRKLLFVSIIAILCVAWLSENFIISEIEQFDSYFLIAYSSLLCFMSIALINRLISTERGSLLKNAEFVICVTFVIYYAFNVLVEVFWIYGLSGNKIFVQNVTNISVFTNLLANLLYSYAIIWMPTKRRFTLPSL